MGLEIFSRHAGQGRDGTSQNHARQGRRPHPSALPRPIAILDTQVTQQQQQ